MSEWFEFSLADNIIDYLDTALDNLRIVHKKPQKNKWVFIALHGALYHLLICAIRGTNDCIIIKKGKLINFRDALDYCMSYESMKSLSVNNLVLSKNEIQVVYKIQQQYRNTFEHFTPCHRSFETKGLIELYGSYIGVIGKVHKLIRLNCTDAERKKINSYIKLIQKETENANG